MMDLDEDTGLVKPKALVARRATLKKAGNSLPIRTLKELDKRIGGGKENNIKKNPSLVVTNLRASLKPVGTGNLNTDGTEESMRDSTFKSDAQKLTSSTVTHDRVIRKDSELLDDDFLNVFPTLSEDDWNALEVREDVKLSELEHGVEGAKDVNTMHTHMEAKDDQLATSIPQAEASQHKLTNEQEKSLSESIPLSSQSSVSLEKASPLRRYVHQGVSYSGAIHNKPERDKENI